MVFEYGPGGEEICLRPDIACEFPIYLFLSHDKSILLYSKFIAELLNDPRVTKPLSPSIKGISILLQSGFVPPPRTAYENVFVLGLGDSVRVSTKSGKVDLQFDNCFPFLNKYKPIGNESTFSEEQFLQLLSEATIKRIDISKPSFLFHSAGKDSNSVALALAEAGWQNEVVLLTHKSKGSADESSISKDIARRLGFRHQVLHEVDMLGLQHKRAILDFFTNSPFPSTDNVSMAYPLYLLQRPELARSNIIDGGGNDCYMMFPPSSRDRIVLPLARYLHHASSMRQFVRSESLFSYFLRTPAEWCGANGFSFRDTKTLLPDATDAYGFFDSLSERNMELDLFDFKTSILSSLTVSEVHIRKIRNFADSIHANLILPFANERLAKYFSGLPEDFLFDRKTLKNKIALRKTLKKRIGLDSDELGKMGFTYDSHSLLLKNWVWMRNEIVHCSLWNQKGLMVILARLEKPMHGDSRRARAVVRLLYRMYLISAWYNQCRYMSGQACM